MMSNCYYISKQVVFLFCLALFLNGCSTIKTFNNWESYPPAPTVYAGTRQNIQDITHTKGYYHLFPHNLVVILGVLDLPFSFLADTVLLPYTIPTALIYQPNQKPESQPQKHQPRELPHSDVDSTNKRNPFLKD